MYLHTYRKIKRGIVQTFIKNKNMKDILHFSVNNKPYQWHKQYITGAEVRQLGAIPADEQIFLAIKKPWEDEPIDDNTKVDLARPGLEHFYSKKQDEFSVVILVNTRHKDWSEREISYEQVARLAFENYIENETTVYTVTYTDGPGQNPEGSMVKGDKVFVKNKMKFNVTVTNRS
jgi:hypothetical protein